MDSDNQELRQQAETNINKVGQDLTQLQEAVKGDFAEAYNQLEQATQLGDAALIKAAQQSYALAVAEYLRVNQHYLDLEDAKQKYETNKNTSTTNEDIKSNVAALTQNDSDNTEQESAVNHVKNFMSQYDSDDLINLAENSIYFTPEQKDSLRQLAEVKVLQNQNKGTSQVANDVVFGLKGSTKLQSHRGLQDYEKLVERGVRTQDNQLIESSLIDLEIWATNHSNKADTLVQAYDKVKDNNQVVQVVPVGNGQWKINTDTSTFLSGKERNETGTINVHKGSNSTKRNSVGLIDQVQQEAALISTTYNALSSYASSFSQNSDLDATANSIDNQNQQAESTVEHLKNGWVRVTTPVNQNTNLIEVKHDEKGLSQKEYRTTYNSIYTDDDGITYTVKICRDFNNPDLVTDMISTNVNDPHDIIRYGKQGIQTDAQILNDLVAVIDGSFTQAGMLLISAQDSPHADKTENSKPDSVLETLPTPDETNVDTLNNLNQQVESDGSVSLNNLPAQDQMTSFESENGITHSIPNKLLDQTYNVKDVSSELNAVSSPTDLLDKQYSDNLLSQLQQAVPDAKINIVSDLNTIQDRGLKAGLKSGGWYIPDTGVSYIAPQADDWHGSAKELINHELIHRATHEALQNDEKAKVTLRDLSDRIRDYIMANSDAMASMDEITEDRIDYMYRSLDEMLAVGIAETNVRKLLPTIIGEDGLKSLDSVFQSLLSGGRYDSVRATPRRTSVSSNGNTKNTKSRITTEVSESSSAGTESQNNQRNESGNSPNVQGSQRKKSAVVEASGTEEQSKPTGLITALRDVNKAVRTQERSKPFKQRNLITAHFNQNTDTNNPLVLVPDFVTSVDKQSAQDFVKDPISDLQSDQLEEYKKFHSSLAQTIHAIFKLKPEGYRYQDYTSFLVNEQGTLDANTVAALSLAAYSTFIENGLKTLNTNKEIAELLHLDEDTYIPAQVAETYREVGQQRAVYIPDLGRKAAQYLGLKVRKDSDPKFQSSLEGSLGALVYMALRTDGLIQETTVTGEDHDSNLKLIHEANNTEYTSPKELGFEYAYVRPALNKEGKVVPRIQTIVETNKKTKGFLSKLFGNDVGLREPLLQQPEVFKQNTIARTSAVVSDAQVRDLTNAQKQGFKIRPTVAKVMQGLFHQDNDYLLNLLGIAVTDAILDSLHISERENFKAKAENEQRALTNAFDFIESLEVKDGEYPTFWDTQYTSSNNRMYYNSNLFNVQTQQIHRTLAGLEAFKTTFDPAQAAIDAQGSTTEYGKFLRGIAENMEGIEDNKFFQDQLPQYTYRTVDKVPSRDFLPAFEAYLNQASVSDAIEAMAVYIHKNELGPTQRTAIQQFVAEGGMGVQSLYALISLAEHHNALINGEKEFTTSVGLGSDGVNNGVAIANVMTGLANENMRTQVGLIPKGSPFQNYFDTKQANIPDYYIEFAQVINSKWGTMKAALHPQQTQALESLFSSWGKRKMAKVWAVPFNYNAGFSRLKSVMAEQFITDIYSQMTKIANLAKGKEKDSIEYQTALNLRDTLQENINKATQTQVRLPEPEQLNETELDRETLDSLFNVAFQTFGQAAEDATKAFANNYINSRDLTVATQKAAYKIYAFVKAKIKTKILKEMQDQGLIEKDGYEGLSSEEQAKIDKELLKYAPVLVTTLGHISENKLESGLVLSKSEMRLNKDGLNQLQISHFNPKGPSKTQTIRVGTAEQMESDIGIGGLALQVQSVDAGISATTLGQSKAINVHDANISGIADFIQMSQSQNKAFFNLVGFYRSQAENIDMLLRTLQGVHQFAQEYGIQPTEFNQLVTEVLGQVPQDQQYIKQEQQGLLTALSKIGFAVGSQTKMSQVLGILIDNAYRAEIQKVQMLLDTKAIHQYAGENGEFTLTDKEYAKLNAELGQLAQAQEQAHQSVKQWVTDLDAVFKGKSTQANQIDFTSSKLTPLQSWFEQRIDQRIDIKDLKKMLGKTLTQKEQVILNALDKLLPPNLFINYFNAANVPDTVSIEDVDLSKVHAWYNAETNTVNIKSVASRGSKVNSATVLHELLHAALAQRIQEVQTNPGKYPEAEQAISSLNTLRNQLLERYADNPTVQGMLESLDEFISYGLTEPELQKLMQAVMVDRGTRKASQIKSMFKAFVDLLGSLLGFRGKQIHALGAFIHDSAVLIQELEPIKPEPTVGMLFSRSYQTETAYEDRIDELFNNPASAKPQGKGVRMLDSSDILDMLGFGGYEVQLDEQHIALSGFKHHPEITQQDYKDVPKWLDNPVMVVEQEDGRYVFITDQKRENKPVIIVVAPLLDRVNPTQVAKKHITVTVFAKHSLNDLAKKSTVVYENRLSPALKSLQVNHQWNRAIASGWGTVPNSSNSKSTGGSQSRTSNRTPETSAILNQNDLAAYRKFNEAAKNGETIPKLQVMVKNKLEQMIVQRLLGVQQSKSSDPIQVAAAKSGKPVNRNIFMMNPLTGR